LHRRFEYEADLVPGTVLFWRSSRDLLNIAVSTGHARA
jgi:hypothetical protein